MRNCNFGECIARAHNIDHPSVGRRTNHQRRLRRLSLVAGCIAWQRRLGGDQGWYIKIHPWHQAIVVPAVSFSKLALIHMIFLSKAFQGISYLYGDHNPIRRIIALFFKWRFGGSRGGRQSWGWCISGFARFLGCNGLDDKRGIGWEHSAGRAAFCQR